MGHFLRGQKVLKCIPTMQVQAELSKIDPYFTKLADGMRAWISAWDELNGAEANGKQ